MMFRLRGHRRTVRRAVAALALGLAAAGSAQAQGGTTAVVPTQIIYPGQEIAPEALETVDVTNPDLRSDYLSTVAEAAGKVASRTLLPGRVIPPSSVREPYAVQRGKPCRIVFSGGGLTITAPGTPLQDAMAGDFIRVRNTDSGITVSGTVMADGTVQVAAR